MNTVSIQEAQAKLAQILDGLAPGEELTITEHEQPIARLTRCQAPGERKLGTMRGTVLYMAPDFDAPLDLR